MPMGSQDKKIDLEAGIIDNPLRYREVPQNPPDAPRSLPIEDWRLQKPGEIVRIPPQVDSMAIMHVLEQIKMEMRTLASEVALLASEVANVRRQMQAPPPVRFYNT